MTESELCEAFKTYFEEMDKCAAAECNWALLHLVLVMPDICAALEHSKGDTTNESGQRYEGWCTAYWPSGVVSPAKRWHIRCALLHQGRTVVKGGETFSYLRPGPAGSRAHEYVEPGELIITLDAGQLADQVRAGMCRWAADLQRVENATRLANVEPSLAPACERETEDAARRPLSTRKHKLQEHYVLGGRQPGRAQPTALPRFASPESHTPKHLTEKILTSRSALEGERKQVAVLFCDLTNSTPFAERLGPESHAQPLVDR